MAAAAPPNNKPLDVSQCWTVTTLAGSARGFADLPGTTARFDAPVGIAVSRTGLVYVADKANRRIRKIHPETGVVETLVHLAHPPEGLAVSPTTGRLYVTDYVDHCILEIDQETGVATPLAVAAGLLSPRGLAVSGTGLVYVADIETCCIHTVDPTTGEVRVLAGSPGFAGVVDGPVGAVARFSSPTSVAVAPSGDIYVADALNFRIRKIHRTGEVTTVPGPAMNLPCGIAVSSRGIVYVAEMENHRIRQIDPETGAVTTLAGSGAPGFLDGTCSTSRFQSPSGVAVGGSDGVVYVADMDNHRIRAITPSANPELVRMAREVVVKTPSAPSAVPGELAAGIFSYVGNASVSPGPIKPARKGMSMPNTLFRGLPDSLKERVLSYVGEPQRGIRPRMNESYNPGTAAAAAAAAAAPPVAAMNALNRRTVRRRKANRKTHRNRKTRRSGKTRRSH
jgi:DNA-binding beta-propeller fold protein YncE